MKTHIATQKEINETHAFHLIDADGEVLGRLATSVAVLLRGKHKPIFTPFLDTGDHVIIVNAEKIVLTGNKLENKKVIHHTNYPGGFREKKYRLAMEDEPEKVIKKAIWGMLPKNRLGRKMLKKLRIYRGSNHPHTAAQPTPFEIK